MRRIVLFLLLCLPAVKVWAQPEALSPLVSNFELTRQQQAGQRMAPAIFIYDIDTVHLPFLDEFSRDRFKKYKANPDDPGVTRQTFYHLLDEAGLVPLHDTVKFMATPSFRIEYDSIDGQLVQRQHRLDSMLVTRNDLSEYPISGTVEKVWPRYHIIDTLWISGDVSDTVWIPLPDWIQDSVYVYRVPSTGDNSLWVDSYAYRNNRYAINPPTIGVATFDGLNEEGYPYQFGSPTLRGIADHLTSKPLYLGTKPNNSPYTAADSLYLSFFYQSTGRGNEPQSQDSLILEFWAPDSLKWYTIWKTPGVPANAFRQVMVPINAFYFLKDGFQFRFKNYGHLSGSLDHWHIDYVYLNSFRTLADTVRDDVAFVYDPNTLLRNYTAMPWAHFRHDPVSFMRDTLSVFQRNNSNTAKLIGGSNMSVFYEGNTEASFNHPNTPSINAYTNFTTLYDVGLQPYVFDTTGRNPDARFEVEFRHNTTPDFCRENDTVRFEQVFENYYAYDDGTAEAAYGVQGAGGRLAYRFTIPYADTLRAVRIHFSPSVNNVSNKAFILSVWRNDGSGGTPGTLLYQNLTFHFPQYVRENNGFYEYPLDAKLLVNGTFYVGMRQLDPDRLNVGFDLNTNARSAIYYNTSGTWLNTGFEGALMIRPVFAYPGDYVVSVDEPEAVMPHFEAYPNPSAGTVHIRIDDPFSAHYTVRVYDLSGRLVHQGPYTGTTIDLSAMQQGIYLLELSDEQRQVRGVKKLIIQR